MKKRMKKVISFVIILLLCCGCNSNKNNDDEQIDLSETIEATNQFTDYLNGINEEIGSIEKIRQKWEDARNSLDNTQEELDNLTKNLNQYSDEYRQNLFPSISSKYDELYEKTKQEYQARINFELTLSQAYGNNNDTSSLEELLKAQLDYDLQYIESSKEIMKQWCFGEIDFNQYKKLLNDLNMTFGYDTIP